MQPLRAYGQAAAREVHYGPVREAADDALVQRRANP